MMAIPFRIEEDEQDEERQTLSEKVLVTSEPVAENNNEQVVESESFMGRLFQELVGVYFRLSSGRSSMSGVRRRKTRNENESFFQPAPSTLLPDLIRSYVQYQPNNPLSHSSEENLPENNHDKINQRLQSLFQTLSYDDLNSELAFDTKMSIDFSYHRIGQGLRRIGDKFESTNSDLHLRHRHPAGGRSSDQKQICLTLEIELSLLIPATLLSLLSLALWKSRPS